MRVLPWALAAVVLTALVPVQAAEDALAGNWKIKLPTEEGTRVVWLLQLAQAESKWTGKILSKVDERTLPAEVSEVSVSDGLLRLTLSIQKQLTSFEGRIPAEKGKSLYGTLLLRGQLVPVELEPTALAVLDPYELRKEELARATAPLQIIEAAMPLISQAEARKARPEEVRSWAERAYKAGDLYGPRQSREIAVRLSEILGEQSGYADAAVNYARRAERTLDAKASASTQRKVLQALASSLTKAGKVEDAKEVEARLKKISLVTVKPYEGRKSKSDRVVLAELFTGAQCPPCVAADLAFDALAKTYKPTEVILLQYHLHIPAPDPLANNDTEARQAYYGKAIQGTPTLMLSGRYDEEAQAGGGMDQAQEAYQNFREAIDLQLERPSSKMTLTAKAIRKGNKIEISTEATGEATERTRLRLALTEEEVAYTGTNRVPLHHHVVRALPGGADGASFKEKTARASVVVDLDELRKSLEKYLVDFAKENAPFPGKMPAIALKSLSVVAFVQDDRTKEILAATQVEVKGGE